MSFQVSADAYTRFMGPYSGPLAPQFADLAGIHAGQQVLDVGCGPGALTAELVRRVGPAAVCAVDPSPSLAAATRRRCQGTDVRLSAAESLPFPDATFDAALAQLVVHFMSDPVAGIREMVRVTRPGGVVAACVWDHGGDRGPLTVFWRAVRDVDPSARDESDLPGVREGDLERIFKKAGFADPVATTLTVVARHASFAEWWDRFLLGVGPTGDYVATLPQDLRTALRERCRQLLTGPKGPDTPEGPGRSAGPDEPDGPVEISATAWAVACRT